MPNAILALNAGSSSLKFALYEADTLVVLCRGEIEEIGRAELKVSGPLAGELNAFGPPPSRSRPRGDQCLGRRRSA